MFLNWEIDQFRYIEHDFEALRNKHKVCPKSYKDSLRGLTSSIHPFYYRSKTVKRAYKSQRNKIKQTKC